jgi:hypothetical protein
MSKKKANNKRTKTGAGVTKSKGRNIAGQGPCRHICKNKATCRHQCCKRTVAAASANNGAADDAPAQPAQAPRLTDPNHADKTNAAAQAASGGAANVANTANDVLVNAAEAPETVLASAEDSVQVEVDGQNAWLTTRLQILPDPVSASRLRYRATLYLQTGKQEDGDGVYAGYVNGWRIAKKTNAKGSASDSWVKDLLQPLPNNLKKTSISLKETALCLRALFDGDGDAQKDADMSEELRKQLHSESLLFIEMLELDHPYQGKGLLLAMMGSYTVTLGLLPEWFAFAGTIVLVPAKPAAAHDIWSGVADDKVEGKLISKYERVGFQVWTRNEVKDSANAYREIVVMGRTV